MMKKFIKSGISILLCAVMIFGSAPLEGLKEINLSGAFKKIAGWFDSIQLSLSASALATSGKCGINVYWEFDEETGTLTISGEGVLDSYDYRTKTLPYYNIPMKKVVINDGITEIGGYAFYGCCLTSVTIPDSVVGIDYFAFMNCRSLTDITISDSVKYISVCAFANCTSLTSIIIPDSVQGISSEAFYGCEQLKNVSLGTGITAIDSRTFAFCSNLTNIILPDSVTMIYEAAFANCSNLTNIILPDSVSIISKDAFNGCTSLNKITIPNKVLNINYAAFAYCSSLESVIFTGNVKTIGEGAFAYCRSLKNITIPGSVTSIGNLAFYQCKSLTEIVIPDNVTSIGDSVFTWCGNLTNVIIGKSVSAIGYGAFACCGLTSIDIPGNVKTIGDAAFCRCDKLNDVTLSDGIISIADNAFDNCTSLKDIIIPESVQDIGTCVFISCTELESVVFLGLSTNMGSAVFYECSKLKNVSLPKGLIQIKDYTFYKCCSLEMVEIPESVTSIEKKAFAVCESLTSIIIPKNVNNIGENVFVNCNALTSITVDSNNTTFDSRNNCNAIIITESNKLFVGCNNSTIPDSVKIIGKGAFLCCTQITDIDIPDGVQIIEMQAFSYCIRITDVAIPKSVYSIGPAAFGGCIDLSHITIDINNPVFDSRENSNSIIISNENELICGCKNSFIPKTIKRIGPGAFFHCDELQQITIPNGLTDIGEYAFYNCTGLTTLTVPNSVIKIDYGAFTNVNNIIYSQNWYDSIMNGVGSPWGAKAVDAYIEEGLYYYDSSKELLLGCSPEKSGAVSIPDSVEEVGENCFNGCENVTSISFSSPVFFADTAVAGCKNLETVTAPDNTDSFGVVYTKPVSDGGFSLDSVSDSNISIEYDTGILFCDRTASGTYTVPQEITRICENAFANCKNVSVNIPSSVNLKRIGENAFLNSADYNDLSKWADNVLIIGNYIVASKSMLSGIISLADSIRGIADSAFKDCSGMTGFRCGGGLRFLGSRAFSGCSTELKNNITLSEGLSYVGKDLFDVSSDTDESRETEYYNNVLVSVSPDVEALEIKEGTTVIAEGAFSGCTNLRSITVPDSVTRIDKNTFKGCLNLQSVTLNSNITEIGDNAFADCISLTEITIPAGVNEIGHLAFYGCTGMERFNVAGGNTKYKSVDGILTSADGKTIIQYPAMKDGTDYTISDNMFISDLAFYRCRKLEKITVGDDIEYGNRNPFASCTAGFSFDGEEDSDILFGDTDRTVLKSVSARVKGIFVVPDTVEEIGSDAFKECTEITGIDFSKAEDIDIIGDYAFYYCTGLTEITVPNTVTKIGKSAFENCLNLNTVNFEADKPGGNNNILCSIGDYAFCNCPCNKEGGKCNYNILKAEKLEIGRNAFKNVFCDSVKIDGSGLIYGLAPLLENLKEFISINDGSISVSCNTKTVGTDSVITVTDESDESSYYKAVIFGDVNGDGIYDGMDSMIVNCIANGMLTKEQVSEAVWAAADCNHDGKTDLADVEALERAGLYFDSITQSR